jgi:ABC-type glycerol-3-phosphate transport system substrate-binding protein
MRRILGRRPRLPRTLALAVVLAAALLAAACSSGPAAPSGRAGGQRPAGVITLDNISTLRSLFNADDGHTRLVLIFSPT